MSGLSREDLMRALDLAAIEKAEALLDPVYFHPEGITKWVLAARAKDRWLKKAKSEHSIWEEEENE